MPAHAVRIPSDGLTLEGVLHVPASGATPIGAVVVCHPHPLYGGEMNNNVVVAIARALLGRSVAVLRFNFRGVGGSQGAHGGGVGEQDDVLAALRLTSEHALLAGVPLGLAGYSFGAGVALRAAARSAHAQDTWRPSTGAAGGERSLPRDPAALALVSPALGQDEIAGMDRLTMPKLLVTGAADMFATVERVEELAKALPGPTETFVSPLADHFWSGDVEEEMAETVGNFFARAFKG
jgi:alpha/beta superfamily hydrolase